MSTSSELKAEIAQSIFKKGYIVLNILSVVSSLSGFVIIAIRLLFFKGGGMEALFLLAIFCLLFAIFCQLRILVNSKILTNHVELL